MVGKGYYKQRGTSSIMSNILGLITFYLLLSIFNPSFFLKFLKNPTSRKRATVYFIVSFVLFGFVSSASNKPDTKSLTASVATIAPPVTPAPMLSLEEKAAKNKADAEAKVIADAEEKTKADAEKKAKEEAEARAKAEADAMAKIVFDVQQVARKSEQEINKLLGEPTNTEKVKWTNLDTMIKADAKMNYYKDDKIEIMFLDGKAHRIRLNLTEQEYQKGDKMKNNLAYIGLPVVELEKPKSSAQIAFYAKISGYYEVSIGDWVGTKEGSVLVVTESKYR